MLEELMAYVCEIHVKSMAVVREHGFRGWVASENYYDQEPLCGPDQDPVALIKADVRTLRSAPGLPQTARA